MRKFLTIILFLVVTLSSYSQGNKIKVRHALDEALILGGLGTVFYSGPHSERVILFNGEITPREITVTTGALLVGIGTYLNMVQANEEKLYVDYKKGLKPKLSHTEAVSMVLAIGGMSSIFYSLPKNGHWKFDGKVKEGEWYLYGGTLAVLTAVFISETNLLGYESKKIKIGVSPIYASISIKLDNIFPMY